MTDFIKLNFRYLIPTNEKKNELFLKLKPGMIVNAKVIDISPEGKLLVNIKGTEVIADFSGKNIKRGDVLQFFVKGIDDEKIFVKLEGNAKKTNLEMNTEIKAKNKELLKSEIMGLAIKEKIFISEDKIDAVIKKYIELNEKDFGGYSENATKTINNSTNYEATLKSLMLLEKNGIEFSNESFEALKSYFLKNTDKKIEINSNFAEKLKNLLKESIEEEGKFEKGMNLINALNKANDLKVIEFAFNIPNNIEPAQIKINYEKNKETGIIDKETFFINFDLNLENMGKTVIKLSSWQKHLEIQFLLENKEYLNKISETENILRKGLNSKGYFVDEIRAKLEEKKPEIVVKEVDFKA